MKLFAHKCWNLCFCIVIFNFCLSGLRIESATAQTKSFDVHTDTIETIQFLTFRITDKSAELLTAKEVVGHYKSARIVLVRDGLQVKALSVDGNTIFEKIVDNPLQLYLEYEDPTSPGQLKSKVVEKDTAYVTIRISGQLDYRYLELHLLQSLVAKGSESTTQTILLGRFDKAVVEQVLHGVEK